MSSGTYTVAHTHQTRLAQHPPLEHRMEVFSVVEFFSDTHVKAVEFRDKGIFDDGNGDLDIREWTAFDPSDSRYTWARYLQGCSIP